MTWPKSPAGRLHRATLTIGLSAGFVALIAAVTIIFMRNPTQNIEILETVCNAAINFLPMLIAAVGEYIAPDQKLINGTVAGWLCLLPGVVLSIIMLGLAMLFLVIPLIFAFALASAFVFIGAVIGRYASQRNGAGSFTA